MEKHMLLALVLSLFAVTSVAALSLNSDGYVGVNGDSAVIDSDTQATTGNNNSSTTSGAIVSVNSDNSFNVDNDGNDITVRINDDRLRANFNNNILIITDENNEQTEVRVTPQQAIARAEVETGASCTSECEVEIDEDTHANTESTIFYEVTLQKQTRVLGYWDAQMDVDATVDAQTGQVIEIDRPWWVFLTSDTRASA